ncbi:hypothetical protein SASPL_136574 [Salvia splendens]|uniref:Uncharacterized protein n=1 Tax=Salvia splendens TaxID=180675 RepID=A0A8X8X288_SALSN|nr:hypothetical protein SASPL_136574 [Salvia splendens]
MLLHLGYVPVLVASSASAAREIMKEQDLTFSNRPRLSCPDRLIYGSKDVAFAPHGDYWCQMRPVFVLRLLSNKRVHSYLSVREEETSLMVEDLRRLSSSSAAVLVNLSHVLVSLTSNVISRVALGRKYGDGGEGNVCRSFFEELLELLGTSPVGDYVPWDELDQWEKDGDGGGEMDFVDILLEFQRREKIAPLFEDDVIKAQILDVFSVGTDTSSNALDWMMAELMRNPSVIKTLQNEVREVAGRKCDIVEEDLVKMPYLKAVMKENLRLHPPVPLLVPRESTKDTVVLGYDVAAGTRVLVNEWKIGRDPTLWKDPEEFRPERFLESSIDFKGFHFELLPFGTGRRGCPGIAFTTAVYELVLAKLVCSFDFGLPNGERGRFGHDGRLWDYYT